MMARSFGGLLVMLLILTGCKTKDCEDPEVPVTLSAQMYHSSYNYLTLPSNSLLVGQELTVGIVTDYIDTSIYDYSNQHWTLNGEVQHSKTWKDTVREPGSYHLEYESDCLRKDEHKRECYCTESEYSASIDFTVYDTVRLFISQINYHPTKQCSYDFPGNGCPDIYISLPQFKLRNKTTWDYNLETTGPIYWDSVIAIPVVQDYFNLEFEVFDDEFAGNHDIVDRFTITPDMVGNWQAGTHATNLGIDFTIEIK
ncbi:MAG: hypothetical protein R2813_13950 [Flavobacteriales bacterium]